MVRNPKRVEIAAPLYREWNPPAGHPFQVVGTGALDEILAIPLYYVYELKFLPGSFPTAEISAREYDELERDIGCSLRPAARRRLHAAVRRFLAGVALDKRPPKWKKLRDQLRKVTEALEAFLATIRVDEYRAHRRGFISETEAAAIFTQSLGLDVERLERIAKKYRERLYEIQRHVIRGEPGDVSFRILMRTIITIARSSKLELKVLYHQTSDLNKHGDPAELTPLMKFARNVLAWSEARARDAIDGGPFRPEEQEAIFLRIQRQTNKSDRQLGDHLESAIKALREEKVIGKASR